MDTEIVRAWVDGWAVSRGAAVPVEEPWGFRIDVGLPEHVTRHVIPDADEALIGRLVEKITGPGTWLKTFVDPEVMAPWLTPAWSYDDPCFLMTTTLHTSAVEVPAGYHVRTWDRGGVTRAVVLAPNGGYAARGQVAGPPGAETVVFDQIETAPAHRRRGLGRAVMRALANAAVAEGARAGVLGATVEGQSLYRTVGWTTRAPLTGVVLKASGTGE
ncbi:GNAT family N-acetyltransferase [Streptomyces sp. MST-110588]|uniref:GNAT family N-acetyltransferase n=1 Tax=Streptomyces sp. MST-110588 TaxID=2833628 RepID=UPI001F5DF904|nr:GNAT family N-acetyltransferase [Streptomyces sp. MST-110588]UNO41982.1 GNAT family N-acetyltransferase [Streptomyces sp. MST-110588]